MIDFETSRVGFANIDLGQVYYSGGVGPGKVFLKDDRRFLLRSYLKTYFDEFLMKDTRPLVHRYKTMTFQEFYNQVIDRFDYESVVGSIIIGYHMILMLIWLEYTKKDRATKEKESESVEVFWMKNLFETLYAMVDELDKLKAEAKEREQLKYYTLNPMSDGCANLRVVSQFLKRDVEFVVVDDKFANSKEFKEMSQTQNLPFLQTSEGCLAETSAIIKYLC